ncbi:hypothetical protein AMECASPLE_004894 [Ameca splendens]|uniref:Uncharacterized protein n=1 Tax=Ameca splendens TaxID=208324 RepID=A0ABV0YXI4_9TELE
MHICTKVILKGCNRASFDLLLSHVSVMSWRHQGGGVGVSLDGGFNTRPLNDALYHWGAATALDHLMHPWPLAERLSCQDASLSFGLTCILDLLFNLQFVL